MNPFCEIAVEEAIRMREKGWVNHVSTISIGQKTSAETLRHSLALGADDAFHVTTDLQTDTTLQPLAVAKVFQKLVEEHKYDIVILGKQAIDDDANQTAQILSALLGWPVANFASAVEKKGDNEYEVTREIDSGLQRLLLILLVLFHVI